MPRLTETERRELAPLIAELRRLGRTWAEVAADDRVPVSASTALLIHKKLGGAAPDAPSGSDSPRHPPGSPAPGDAGRAAAPPPPPDPLRDRGQVVKFGPAALYGRRIPTTAPPPYDAVPRLAFRTGHCGTGNHELCVGDTAHGEAGLGAADEDRPVPGVIWAGTSGWRACPCVCHGGDLDDRREDVA